MLMHTCNQRIGEAGGVEDHYKFEDSLVYRADTKNKETVNQYKIIKSHELQGWK